MIRFTGTFDQSGYGNAARDTCMALIHAGYNVATQVIVTPMSRQEAAGCNNYAEIIKRINPNVKAKVNITELIPPLWHNAFQKDTYNIGYFFWEVDLLPDEWVKIINEGLCNEVWVPCEWNKVICQRSGVNKPIYVIYPVTQFSIQAKQDAKKLLPIGGKDDAYRFYSIFQWSNRKNGDGLLRAYFNEFTSKDNVLLVIKSYGSSVSVAERRIIKEVISDLKRTSSNPDPPPVYFFGELLKPNEVSAIHPQCHCYISPHRGEGWGIPIAEAMSYGNQVVTTKIGGITDFLDDKNKPTGYIIPNTWETVTKMPWTQYYNDKQKWGGIKDLDIQYAMRQAYDERNNFSYRVNNYKSILDLCSEGAIIKLIKERLSRVL